MNLKYAPASPLVAAAGGEKYLNLGYWNGSTWVSAIDGNSGGSPTSFDRAYNPTTDLVLGYHGVDVDNNVVWAVVDHNSSFAVVPEPATLLLLLTRISHHNAALPVADGTARG